MELSILIIFLALTSRLCLMCKMNIDLDQNIQSFSLIGSILISRFFPLHVLHNHINYRTNRRRYSNLRYSNRGGLEPHSENSIIDFQYVIPLNRSLSIVPVHVEVNKKFISDHLTIIGFSLVFFSDR